MGNLNRWERKGGRREEKRGVYRPSPEEPETAVKGFSVNEPIL